MIFRDERFGMFVHFGLYSVGGWQEQERWRRGLSKEEYENLYFPFFDPKTGCTDQWARAARDAGMEYLCLTAKHHDGFCLWNTSTTDFNVMNTPCGRDLVAETAESCRRYGLRFELYYSLPDWHCPYAVQGGDHALPFQNEGDTPDWGRYKEYLKTQITELLTGYGKIDALFWDIPATEEQQDESINAYVRSLQPGILINDRGFSKGDYSTPERTVPSEPFSGLTEACQSVGGQSWGYREDEDYFSHAFLIRSIDGIMTKGGNYLLNVGPKGDGSLPEEALASLSAVGGWMKRVREAFYPACFYYHPDISYPLTADFLSNTLYLHLNGDRMGIGLPSVNVEPLSAVCLNSGEEIPFRVEYCPEDFRGYSSEGRRLGEPCLHLHKIPVDRFPGEVLVVKLVFADLKSALGRAFSEKT